jgi:hypothetical protein
MPILDPIEVLVLKELQGLCMNCEHFNTCTYRRNSAKLIIQCELYEVGREWQAARPNQLKGLCMNCNNADICRLPQKQHGVWHCEEYE